MNDNTTDGGDNSLMTNEHVIELFALMKENGKDISGLTALINHVSGMENFAKQAENQIADMKSQLETMKEVQDHPIKTALQNTIKTLETKVAEIKTQIAELKTNIVNGCKNAVSEFKEHGVAALDKIASFFKIKNGLQAIKLNTAVSADNCDKAAAKIESFSNEFHKSARGFKNMARIMVGKKPIDAVKEAGKLSKAVSAPYKAEKACLLGIQKQVDKMITTLENLEQKTEVSRNRKAEKSKKPSLLAALESNEKKSKEQFAQKSEPGKETPKKTKNEAEV